MEVDLELEMKLSYLVESFDCFCFTSFDWVAKQRKQQATYVVRWVKMYSPFVQHNIAFIDSRMVTSNSMIYPIVEDHCRWIWIF